MTTEQQADDPSVTTDDGHVEAEAPDDALPGLTAALRRLVAEGLGPAMGLRADWRRRSAIERVARLGPKELARRLDDIYRSQRTSLVGHAQRILGSREDAEDVVNEAFARVLRADPDLSAPEALAGYLRTAVRNDSFDRGSANTRDRATRVTPTATAAAEDNDPAHTADLDAVLTSADRPVEDRVCDDLTLALALRMLSVRQRQCFSLRFVDGLSVGEVAVRLGISDGNVKRTCHEARARIAAALAAA